MSLLITRCFAANKAACQLDLCVRRTDLCLRSASRKSQKPLTSASCVAKNVDIICDKKADKVKKLGKKTYVLLNPSSSHAVSPKQPLSKQLSNNPSHNAQLELMEHDSNLKSFRPPEQGSKNIASEKKSQTVKPRRTPSNEILTTKVVKTDNRQTDSRPTASVEYADAKSESTNQTVMSSDILSANVRKKQQEESIDGKSLSSGDTVSRSRKLSLIKSDNFVNSILTCSYLGEKPAAPDEISRNALEMSYVGRDPTLPSVSSILNSTMSPVSAANLARWKELMISKLGADGFLSYQKSLFQRGRDFHALIEKVLNDTKQVDTHVSPSVEACFKSIQNVLPHIKGACALESEVVHSQLHYRGYLDCVAEYKGQLSVIEWKHSEKKKMDILSTYDNPIQLMAYMGALNVDNRYPYQVNSCLLVIAYTDGSPADVYHLDHNEKAKFWQMWLERLKLFWEQKGANPEIIRYDGSKSTGRVRDSFQQGSHQKTVTAVPSQTAPPKIPQQKLSPIVVEDNSKLDSCSKDDTKINDIKVQHSSVKGDNIKDSFSTTSNILAASDVNSNGKRSDLHQNDCSVNQSQQSEAQVQPNDKNKKEKSFLSTLWKIWK